MSWANDELQGLHLGDQRLNRRGTLVLERLFADPQASINTACQGWAETQAAYRFFNNRRVRDRPQAVLEPHVQATHQRIGEHPVVLIAQDTTELDYSDHPANGTGPLNNEQRLGLLDHTHAAFTPDGLCLGVLGVKLWARSPEDFGKSKERQYDPLETKETYRWLEGYRLACRSAAQVPQTHIISVADCEGDLYEVFVEAEKAEADAKADYVIRVGKNRSLTEKDPDAGPNTYRKLQQEIAEAPVLLRRSLDLPRTPKREPRTAQLEIRAAKLFLKAPYRKHVTLPDLWVHVVLVSEVDPPEDVEPVQWLLITSLPIDTPEQVLAVVDYYVGRWPIEVFFRVFKTGCAVEKIQLETLERLEPCLLLYKIVAWRVLYVTMLGRECPDLPCDVIFADEEWKPVWRITQPTPLPKKAPRLADFVAMLGSLGGHNGRRLDGPPGPQALWVGMRRMTDFALAWLTFGPDHHPPSPDAENH